jgi:hypothetical protein
MTRTNLFVGMMAAAVIAVVISGCVASGPATPNAGGGPPLPTASPAPNLLYVDHNGTFYIYQLPLTAQSKPARTLTEWPNAPIPPVIAADQYGNVALSNQKELRIFKAPILSFEPKYAKLRMLLNPAITGIASGEAALVDIEFDPNENLWFFNDLGPEITEVRAPVTKSSVAAVVIPWGAPGSKTFGFSSLVQGRFDINATLYVYALSSKTGRLFKIGFPYAKPPGSLGINLGEADFVDTTQWPPTAPNAPSLLLGQYTGQLHSPPPGVPPSPPVDVMGQFVEPLNPVQGLFPNQHVNTIVGALTADTYRYSFYTLDADDGALQVYGLPMQSNAKPKISLRCLAGLGNCDKGEHVFTAP